MKWIIYNLFIKPRLDHYIELQIKGWIPSSHIKDEMKRLAELEKYYLGEL